MDIGGVWWTVGHNVTGPSMMDEKKISNHDELASTKAKFKQALLKIREQQNFITDLTTLPFKLFDVNKQSKQYKSHLIRQRSSKYNLILLRASHDTLNAKRQRISTNTWTWEPKYLMTPKNWLPWTWSFDSVLLQQWKQWKIKMIKIYCWNNS